jgi:N-acetyl-anhydromuramyl-L-alanine amidase AmpD
VTVHYTADRDIARTARSLIKADLGYHLFIDRGGEVTQMTSFDQICWHAGNAVWAGKSPNKNHISLALISWGALTEIKAGIYQSWAKTFVPPSEVEIRPDNVKGLKQPWDVATLAQISALIDVLRFCIGEGIDVGDICGHDECALPPGRKLDPGGVLPMSMSQLRSMLGGGIPSNV